MSKSLKTDILIFLSVWAFYSILSVINPVMPDFDWLNYHHYNAWAVLNDRLNFDFLAANSRSCINPICNIINYFLMGKLNNHSYLFFVLSSLDTAFLMFFAYKIINYVFSGTRNLWVKNTALIFSFLFLAYSPLIINETDFSRNDAFVGVFLLSGFYIFIRNYFDNFGKKRLLLLFLCGILFGTALGLKLAVYPIVVALGVLFLVFFKESKNIIKDIFSYVIGVLTSFLVFDGWWIAKCFSVFKNPFFPYFNNFFQSPYCDIVNHLPHEYFSTTPKNFLQWIFCPFLREDNLVFFLENGGFEPRFGLAYVAVIVLFVMLIFSYKNKKFENLFDFTDKKKLLSILIFVSVSYVLDLATFGTNGRFLTGIFPLMGLIVASLIFAIFNNLKSSKFFICLNLSIILIFSWGISSFGNLCFWKDAVSEDVKSIEKLTEAKDLNFSDNSVVLLLTQATSFIAPYQNNSVQYVGFQVKSDIFDKYKDEIYPTDIFLYAKYFPSKYSEKYNQDLILSDKKLYTVFYEGDFLNLISESLNEYNSQRKVPRRLKNCKYVLGVVFGTDWGFGGNYVCEFN